MGHMQVCTSLQTDSYASTLPLSGQRIIDGFSEPFEHCNELTVGDVVIVLPLDCAFVASRLACVA